jgi:peptidoglycan/xylan/chitin deacetylase (PgdA/CDA1 family)
LTNPLTRPPAWLRPLFPGSEWRGAPLGPTGRPRLYLTFDDGPIPDETPWVLEQLAAYQAQATFFCVGDNLRRHPDVARAALAAGHRLGNHTQHHQSAWATPRAHYLAGVRECQELLAASHELLAGGYQPALSTAPDAVPITPLGRTAASDKLTANSQQLTANLFRPPYGRLTWPVLRALRQQHYRVIMWTLLTRDYDASLAPERALRLTLAATRPGDIVVLHDSRKASRSLRYLLPRLLAHYAALDYEFAAL